MSAPDQDFLEKFERGLRAKWESEQLAARSLQSRQAVVSAKRTGTYRPKPPDYPLETVECIIDLVLSGRTHPEIVDFLNQHGVAGARREDWTLGMVRKVQHSADHRPERETDARFNEKIRRLVALREDKPHGDNANQIPRLKKFLAASSWVYVGYATGDESVGKRINSRRAKRLDRKAPPAMLYVRCRDKFFIISDEPLSGESPPNTSVMVSAETALRMLDDFLRD